jgi:hypothetical protein
MHGGRCCQLPNVAGIREVSVLMWLGLIFLASLALVLELVMRAPNLEETDAGLRQAQILETKRIEATRDRDSDTAVEVEQY